VGRPVFGSVAERIIALEIESFFDGFEEASDDCTDDDDDDDFLQATEHESAFRSGTPPSRSHVYTSFIEHAFLLLQHGRISKSGLHSDSEHCCASFQTVSSTG
jgi:hypothetical protein